MSNGPLRELLLLLRIDFTILLFVPPRNDPIRRRTTRGKVV